MQVGKKDFVWHFASLNALGPLYGSTELPRMTWMYCRPIPSYSRSTALFASKRVDAMAYEGRRYR